jgi:glycosyltransferase involved in cell wall biosynthesis
MDVSIITSLYKSELFLSKYIRRIELFNKKITKYQIEIEFIIIANEISVEEENELAKCRLTNLKILKVPRETLYSSWNRGIREASSGIIAFWNVDDLRFTKAFHSGVSQIRKGAELVYFSFIIFGINRVSFFKKRIRFPFLILRRVNAAPYNKELFMKGCMGGPFFMFHKRVVDKIGPFDESFTIAGDFDWFARASFSNIKFTGDKQIGGIFFVHSNNISGINHQIHVSENEEVSKRYSKKM